MPSKVQWFSTLEAVRLPVGYAPLTSPNPAITSHFRLHVLLVEPARDEREMYAEHLRDCAMHVTCASSLTQALDLARAGQPHVVVIEPCWRHSTDRGLATIRALHGDPRTAVIPIVAVSGHAFAHEREAALEAGCEAFFQKPCAPESLASELERLSWRYRLRPAPERRRAWAK